MCGIDFGRTRLSEGAVEFFATFVRFEFALKSTRYLAADRDDGATANWDRFANDLGRAFFEQVQASGSAPTLIERPPKKQVVTDGRLDWRPATRVQDVQQLFVAVRRVRNNLVHGGKSGDPEHDPEDPRRNENLIAEAHGVLCAALLAVNDVRRAFEGRE